MTSLESTEEKKLLDWVKKQGGICIKLPSQWYRGIPDRLVLLPGGRAIFVELKRKKGSRKIFPTQNRWLRRLEGLGFTCMVLDDLVAGLPLDL